MTPFVLSHFDKDFENFRELREAELASVGGGMKCKDGNGPKESTITVNGDGSKDDGCDDE